MTQPIDTVLEAGVEALRSTRDHGDDHATVTAIRTAMHGARDAEEDALMAASIDRIPLVRADETPDQAAGRLDPIPSFQLATLSALRNTAVSVLLGAAGPERTRLLRIMADMTRQEFAAIRCSCEVLELAATRRAALRMGPEATTVHAALGWDPVTRTFDHDAFNPLSADLIVVDYADLLDKETITLLLAARGEARVVLTRDPDMAGSTIPESSMDTEMVEE